MCQLWMITVHKWRFVGVSQNVNKNAGRHALRFYQTIMPVNVYSMSCLGTAAPLLAYL